MPDMFKSNPGVLNRRKTADGRISHVGRPPLFEQRRPKRSRVHQDQSPSRVGRGGRGHGRGGERLLAWIVLLLSRGDHKSASDSEGGRGWWAETPLAERLSTQDAPWIVNAFLGRPDLVFRVLLLSPFSLLARQMIPAVLLPGRVIPSCIRNYDTRPY